MKERKQDHKTFCVDYNAVQAPSFVLVLKIGIDKYCFCNHSVSMHFRFNGHSARFAFSGMNILKKSFSII